MITQRRRLVLAISAALLPLLAVAGVLIWLGATATEEQIVRERAADARAAALVVDLFISDNVSALEILGMPGRPAVDDVDVARAAKALTDAAALNPNWNQVGLVDSKGLNVLPSTNAPARSVSVADRDYFVEAMRTGRPSVSGAIIGRFSGKPTVVIAIPVVLGSGDRGLLTGIISLAFLEDKLRALPGSTETEVIVVDRAGRAIVHPDAAVVASLTDLSSLPSVEAVLVGESGVLHRVDAGTEVIAAYAPAVVPRWGVVVREPTSSAFGLIRGQVTEASALLAVGALFALAIAWSLGSILERYYDRVVDAERRLASAKGELLNTLGHELKTPLAALSLAAEALGRTAQRRGSGDERTMRYVALIREQVKRATALVTELLDSSRLEHQLPFRRDRVDLGDLVRAAVDRHQAALPDGTIHEIALSVEDEIALEGDASRLEQVITNLLTNAVKYSPNGGTIDVRLARADGQARIVVADHGIGIPPDERDSVFGPFVRSRAARERGIDGTGLGLYLTKRIIEAHGGVIAVADTPGGGTTMVVELPMRLAATR